MLITENIIIGQRVFTHTYSDANRYVVRDNVEYEEAYDFAELGRTYTEGRLIDGGED